jgi:hypothetical protein
MSDLSINPNDNPDPSSEQQATKEASNRLALIFVFAVVALVLAVWWGS